MAKSKGPNLNRPKKNPRCNKGSKAQHLHRKKENKKRILHLPEDMACKESVFGKEILHLSKEEQPLDCLKNAIYDYSVPIIKTEIIEEEIPYLPNEEQQSLDFSKNAICEYSVPIIKTEILDLFEQNQEYIIPDYPPNMNFYNPMCAETAVSNSSENLLPNIKVEHTETADEFELKDHVSFNSNGFEDSFFPKHKLKKCSVLLYDCLIPENLASISAKFKRLRINTNISRPLPKVNSFLQSDTLFLPHVLETYEKIAFLGTCAEKGRWMKEQASLRKRRVPLNKKKTSKRTHKFGFKDTKKKKVDPKKTKKKENPEEINRKEHLYRSKKYVCNCLKDAKVTIKRRSYEHNFELTQQLCSCFTNHTMTSEPMEMVMKETSLFDPFFGKIACGINKIEPYF